ncbi:MAG: anti-sigma factor antagonist [Poseidonibacter sp.]|uniref:anti-sigma factor antagonist n=1 Tax=Poseidonibacter sp. TaxID=2321188 RepID=UPI00359D6053
MFNVNYENKNNIVIVRLSGELMVESVENLKNEFNQYKENSKYFIFDFKNVTMIDSSGLGYIVYCLKKLREKNGDAKIQHLVDQAKLIFEITRVSSILDIYSNEEQAIQSIENMENSNESHDSNTDEIIS